MGRFVEKRNEDMKKQAWVSMTSLELPRALALGTVLVGLFSMVSVFAAEMAGNVVNVTGKVLIRNEAKVGGKTMREVKAGDKIYKGDIINTDSTGSMKLLMTDKSILDLGGSTLFKVDDYKLNGGANRKVNLEMSYGKIRASINQKLAQGGQFKIKTKAATMGVRGTEFIVSSDVGAEAKAGDKGTKGGGSEMKVQVIEGLVAVKTEGKKAEVPLAQGQALTAKVDLSAVKEGRGLSSQASEVKVSQMNAAEMKTATSELKGTGSETFKAAVVIDSNNSLGSDKSGGQTMSIITNELGGAVAEASANGPSLSDMGFAGTFGANGGFDPGFNPGINGSSSARVSVTFHK